MFGILAFHTCLYITFFIFYTSCIFIYSVICLSVLSQKPFQFLGCFCSMFWDIIPLYYQFQSLDLNMSAALYTSNSILLFLTVAEVAMAALISTSDPLPLEAKCPWHNTASTMFDRWHIMLQITSSPFLSPYFTLPINLEQVYFGFICAVNLPLGMVRIFFSFCLCQILSWPFCFCILVHW